MKNNTSPVPEEFHHVSRAIEYHRIKWDIDREVDIGGGKVRVFGPVKRNGETSLYLQMRVPQSKTVHLVTTPITLTVIKQIVEWAENQPPTLTAITE